MDKWKLKNGEGLSEWKQKKGWFGRVETEKGSVKVYTGILVLSGYRPDVICKVQIYFLKFV